MVGWALRAGVRGAGEAVQRFPAAALHPLQVQGGGRVGARLLSLQRDHFLRNTGQ